MIKIFRFVKKRADLTNDEFKNYWLTKHAEYGKMLVEKAPIHKITASFTMQSIGEKESPFDGMAEVYFDSFQDLKAFLESRLYEGAMQKDEENFADLTGDLILVIAEEHVIAERPKKQES